jgi:hypothetical protein
VTSEELAGQIQLPNQDLDDQKWGTVEDLKDQARESNIGDITPFLGPIRAIVFFMGAEGGKEMSPIFANLVLLEEQSKVLD